MDYKILFIYLRFFRYSQVVSKFSKEFQYFRFFSNMSTPARRRLMRDFKRLQDDPPVGVSGAPTDNNILLWNAVIFGYLKYENISPKY